MADYIFNENQKFKKVFIWVIMIFSLSIFLLAPLVSFFGNRISNGIWVFVLVLCAVIILISSIRMQVRIDHNKLMFRYIPFINTWKTYSTDEIQDIKIIKYHSLREFGGWGIRYNFDSWLYNTGGRYGIKVISGNKKFILGTYKPDEASKAIEQFKSIKYK
ncbi:hypothetical protein [Anditalea andensis]|uniref:Bacterial Pleckstrin homology domain-containing protein n=1 Tax=Anditalea andensis TaxID=1048983 RepID=A0A074KWI4_9BACT|nr:hypothetical protein [Anditalea andensis]KEO74341.1 hypothetical protein EL17_06290 [Anditalea andensis]